MDGPDPAYGVFDTLLVRGGSAVDLVAHVSRLTASARSLYDVPVDPAGLTARIVADAGGLVTARVRTSYDPNRREWDIVATRIEEPELDPRTLVPRPLLGGLGAHKWCDRRLVANPEAADDVLLVDEMGAALECGTANIFAVLHDGVVTPPLDGRILAGTVRARVLESLRGRSEGVVERAFTLEELQRASEVFTTSSIRGVQPVSACAGVGSWPMGPTTQWLRQALASP